MHDNDDPDKRILNRCADLIVAAISKRVDVHIFITISGYTVVAYAKSIAPTVMEAMCMLRKRGKDSYSSMSRYIGKQADDEDKIDDDIRVSLMHIFYLVQSKVKRPSKDVGVS